MAAYKKPTTDQAATLAELDEVMGHVYGTINSYIEPGRRVSIALTHLETAEMFLRKAIVHGDAE